MRVDLDHLIVPSNDRVAAARQLAGILGVEWDAQASIGPFSAVYLNDGLTLDFDQREGPIEPLHYCFRVDEQAFAAILGRLHAAGIAYRSGPHGDADHGVNHAFGGSLVYWSEPDGHAWEVLTVSYARPARAQASGSA